MRKLVLGALLAVLAQSAGATAEPAPATQARPAATGLALAPCRLAGVEHEVRCGTLRRPLDPARPDGLSIDVHVAVLPALARNKHPDPLLFFAGGPGQSAIGLAGSVGRLFARLSNRRDIVLVDQRGTGRSAALSCDQPVPTTPLRELLDVTAIEQRTTQCLQGLQKLPHGDLRHFTTTVAMQDVDAVRAALRIDRVNLVGGSYGTRAALEYQRQFPQHVRRVVLDGVAPPDMALPAAFATDNEAAWQALLTSCANEPACAQRHPALGQTLQRLLQSLPRTTRLSHPVTGVVEDVTMQRDVVLSIVRSALYVPARAAALPWAIEQAAAGRFEALSGLGMLFGGGRKGQELAMGMHYAVVCAEDLPRMRSASAVAAPTFGDGFQRQYERACAQLPRAHVPEAFYGISASKVAVLVLSGGVDPATPPRHGEQVTRGLGAMARHVVVPQAGHGTMAIPCLRDVVFRFIDAADDATAQAVDTGCAASLPRPPAFALPQSAGVQP